LEFAFILVLVFFLALALIVFKLSKTVLKALVFALSLCVIALVIGAAFVFYDFYDLKSSFASSQKTAIIKNNGSAVASMAFNNEETSFADNEKLNEYSGFLKKMQYSMMLKDSYRLIIIDAALIEDLGSIKITNNTLPASSARTAILSNDDELKKNAMEAIIKKTFDSPLFMFEQYKKGNLMIYPETAAFKAIKFFPSSLARSAAQKIFEGAKITGKAVTKKVLEEI